MIHKIKTLIKRLGEAGPQHLDDPFIAATIKISNYSALLAGSVCLFFIPVHIFLTRDINSVITCAVVFTLFLTPVLLNLNGLHRLSQSIFIFVVIISLLFGAYVTGYKTNVQIFFLVAFNLFYLAFLNTNPLKLAATFFILLASYLAVEYNIGNFFHGVARFDDTWTFILGFLYRIVTIVLTGIMTRFIVMLIHKSNAEKKITHDLLMESKNDINIMLQNLKQGVFTIIEDTKIHPEYSNQLLKIIEKNSLHDKDARYIFSKGFNISSDNLDMLIAALNACIGESDLNFELNEHILPRKLEYEGYGERKYLELDWIPIIDQRIVTKVLVSIKDNTELVAFKRQEQTQKILVEIFNAHIEDFDTTYYELSFHITFSLKLIARTLDHDAILEIRRRLHTLKGEARFLGWATLSDSVNVLENELDTLGMRNVNQTFKTHIDSKVVGEKIENLGKILTQYKSLYDEKVRIQSGQAHSQKLKSLIESLTEAHREPSTTENRLIFIELQKMFTHRYLSDILSLHKIELVSIARNLGKEPPEVIVSDNQVAFKRSEVGFLGKIFSHLLTNAIDHGIESPTERAAKGKPAMGTIRISSAVGADCILITVGDDGGGLDLSKIAEKAKEFGLNYSSNRELAALIFESGLSTRGIKTEYSGHGVGLNAVKALLKEHDCDITVDLADTSEKLAIVDFVFYIKLPLELAVSYEQNN